MLIVIINQHIWNLSYINKLLRDVPWIFLDNLKILSVFEFLYERRIILSKKWKKDELSTHPFLIIHSVFLIRETHLLKKAKRYRVIYIDDSSFFMLIINSFNLLIFLLNSKESIILSLAE